MKFKYHKIYHRLKKKKFKKDLEIYVSQLHTLVKVIGKDIKD